MNLQSYRKNVYSQNGEDGIIQEIFRRLEIENGFVVGLARTKGYSLVAHCGNCIFVRDDLFHKIGIEDNSLTKLWGW